MKHQFSLIMLLACIFHTMQAQTWTAPQVPGESLDDLSSSEVVYFYNVEADAFLINGMTWGTNACATRLTNGDAKESDPQRCYAFADNGKVRVRMKKFNTLYVSCLSNDANNMYVDQNINPYFTYTETAEGSCVYTLNNDTYKKDLDVTWDFGGHLTLIDGASHTKWAFIKESTITEGGYMAYKAKLQLYGIYKALADAGKTEAYSTYINNAKAVYDSESVTATDVIEASRTLFNAVYGDITTPIDVSFLFDDADMAGNADVSAWNGSGSFGWGEFEAYHTLLKMTQTQTVPQGVYDVALHALYREDGSGSAPQLVATGTNSASASIPAIGDMDYAVENDQGNNWVWGTPVLP